MAKPPVSRSVLADLHARALRMRVPDPGAQGFREDIARQVAELRDAPEQEETTAFLEAIEREDGWPA